MKKLLVMLPALAVGMCLADESPSAVTSDWSSVTCVDTRPDAVRFAKTGALITYAPRYSGGTAVDHVVLRTVRYAGTSAAVTNTVGTYAAGAEGGYAFDFAAGDERCYRLLHTAYDANNAAVGETLAADVAYAVTGAGTDEAFVDTRENSLQLVADELATRGGGTVPLAYSTDWATNGTPASVRITCVCDCRRKNGELVSSRTNTVFSAAAPATGDCPYAVDPGKGGAYTFYCSFLDAGGDPQEDDLTASYGFPVKFGLLLLVK